MKDFLEQMRWHVAYTSVGPSTVRGQRTPGLVKNLRVRLAEVDLAKFASCTSEQFPGLLDAETLRIQRRMPPRVRYWGIARKVLNIFLRAATYNHFLRDEFNLAGVESLLELPLDSLTVKGLTKESPARTLPRWRGVKYLEADDSKQFQEHAGEIATQAGMARVHLDIYLWLDREPPRTNETNSL